MRTERRTRTAATSSFRNNAFALVTLAIAVIAGVNVATPWPRSTAATRDTPAMRPSPSREPSACGAARHMRALGKTTEYNLYFARCLAQGGGE